ncbi:MAG: PAS domain S-box protein [Promethearchaeota archaeon]
MIELIETTCLIIAKDDQICKRLSDIFKRINFNVVIANSGEEAINKAEIIPFNLAFIVSGLPDMSFLVLIKNLKKKYPDRNYIVISENPSMQNEINALRAGANDYFIKPYKIEDIVTRAKELVQNQYLQSKLKESEEKFRRIAEETFVGITIIQDNRIVYYNQAFSDIAGYTIEEMLNWNIDDLVKPVLKEYREEIFKYITTYQQDAKKPVVEAEFPYYTKKNELKWVRVNLKTIKYLERNALLVTMIDITKRKRAELSLKESEKKFRRLFESNPDLFFLIDKDFTFLEFSGKEEDLYVKPENFLGKKITEIFPPERSKIFIDVIENTFSTKRPQIFEYQLPMKDGLHHYEGQILYFSEEKVALFARDITSRKKVEIFLKESEEKFRKIFESNPDLFFFISKDYTFLDYSGNEEYLYTKPKYFLGKNISEIFPSELSKMFINVIDKTFSTKTPQTIEYHLPMKDYLRYYEARLLFFSEQKIAAFIRDITDKKQAEMSLKESEEKFREITEQMFIGVAILQDNKIVYSNKAQSNITGYSLEEILDFEGDRLLQPIHEDYRENVLKFISDYQPDLERPVSEIEFPFYTKKKELKWILLKRRTIIYQQRYAILVTTIDITEKKFSELSLKESEEKFRKIAEQTFIGITIIQDNKFLYGNQILSDITGYSINEMLAFDINEAVKLVSENYRKLVLDIIIKYQMDPKKPVSEMEFLTYTRNGVSKWIRGNFKTITYQEKNALLATFIDITERKEAEIALKESEEKFRRIAEQTFVGIGIVQDNKIAYCNQAFSDINGYSIDEMLNWTVDNALQLVSEDNRELLLNYINDYQMDPEKPVSEIEFLTFTRNGESKWIRGNFKTIMYQERNALLATLIDITEKKQAELDLKESEEKFRNIAEQSLMGIIILQDGVFKYFNDRISEMNGYSVEEIKDWLPDEWVKTIYSGDREFVREQALKKQLGDPNITNHYRYRAIRKDGEIRWMEIFSKTIIYRGHTADLAMIVDITDRIKTEEKLKESEEKFRKITEQTFVGYVILQDEKIVYSNKAHSDITGYSLDEILSWEGNNIVQPVHENYRSLVSFYINEFQNSTEQLTSEIEFPFYAKNKELKWVRTQVSTIFYQQKRAILISVIDVTEQKKAEEMIRQEVQKLKELDELRNEFIDRASHELKTPLNSLYSASSLFLNLYQNEMNHKQLRLIKIINNGAKRLEKLVKNLLDSSRMDIGKLKLKIKNVNIIDLLKESIDEFYHMIIERKLKLNTEFPKEAYIECDKLRIQQVFNNIISNAVKNTPPNGQVLISLKKTINDVEIIFSDTGVGFTEREKTKIFQKFGKIERYGKGMDINTEGSGLGLFISKEIVNLHKGNIRIESEGRNAGTKCIITLPIKINPE